MARSIKETVLALKDRRMLFIFLLGLSSGLPFALTLGTLQAWMSEPTVNVSLKTIGLFAFLRLPYSLKFFWSPFLDRYQLPFLDRRRGWIAAFQALVALTLIGLSVGNPQQDTLLFMVIVLGCNFFSASQDIVIDAYRREILKEEELGLGSALYVDGYLIAFRYISGAGAILLSSYIAWGTVYLAMAALMIIFIFVTIKAPAVSSAIGAPVNLRSAFLEPFKEFFARNGALTILTFIILYKIGDNMASTMTVPFILKNGFSKEEYVAVVKVWGLVAVLIGGVAGGVLVHRMGIVKALWIMGFFQALSTAAFALLDGPWKGLPLLIAVIGFENFTAGMGTSAYTAYMGAMTNVRFSATQYALFSSLMAIPGAIFAARTGVVSEQIGWVGFFVFCALIAIPGMFLIPFLEREPTQPILRALKNGIIGITILGGIYALWMNAADLVKMFI